MAGDAAYKQHAEQLNEWRREDTADDERWQQRAVQQALLPWRVRLEKVTWR